MEACDFRSPYVLMTAAHNEAGFIENTIRTVVAQTVQPRLWVIVSDNSTDETDALVERYAEQFPFIRLLRVVRPTGRSFGSKVLALQNGYTLLNDVDYDFIGNLDADITLGADYFEALLDHMQQNPRIGIAAGFIHEETGGVFRSRSSNRVDSVPHAAQLVRRSCYEQIGGYTALRYGGEDWYAQTSARMNGWHAEAIPALRVFHHRHTGTASSILRDRFRLGRLDYSVGSDPVFEVFKCALRVMERPMVVGAALRMAGFFWSSARAEERAVSPEVVSFLRQEQKAKITGLFRYTERRGLVRAQQ
jgi:biofilm PGA synthesis N-glycosyltransferase PgaC